MTIWVAELIVVDNECYADGPDTRVSLHFTRAGAAEEIRKELRSGTFGTGAAHFPAITDDSDAEEAGEWTEDGRFEWTWSLYPRVVQP